APISRARSRKTLFLEAVGAGAPTTIAYRSRAIVRHVLRMVLPGPHTWFVSLRYRIRVGFTAAFASAARRRSGPREASERRGRRRGARGSRGAARLLHPGVPRWSRAGIRRETRRRGGRP